MHPGHFDLASFLILMLIVVLVVVGTFWGGFKLRGRLFAGPSKNEWLDASRNLDRRDRFRVQWATQRRRPVDHVRLAAAQLAFIHYAEHTFERSPLIRRPRLRFAFAGFYLVLGAGEIALGVAPGQSLPVINLIMGAMFLVLGLIWMFLPQSMRRNAGRLEKLRDQIGRRYGDLSLLDTPAD